MKNTLMRIGKRVLASSAGLVLSAVAYGSCYQEIVDSETGGGLLNIKYSEQRKALHGAIAEITKALPVSVVPAEVTALSELTGITAERLGGLARIIPSIAKVQIQRNMKDPRMVHKTLEDSAILMNYLSQNRGEEFLFSYERLDDEKMGENEMLIDSIRPHIPSLLVLFDDLGGNKNTLQLSLSDVAKSLLMSNYYELICPEVQFKEFTSKKGIPYSAVLASYQNGDIQLTLNKILSKRKKEAYFYVPEKSKEEQKTKRSFLSSVARGLWGTTTTLATLPYTMSKGTCKAVVKTAETMWSAGEYLSEVAKEMSKDENNDFFKPEGSAFGITSQDIRMDAKNVLSLDHNVFELVKSSGYHGVATVFHSDLVDGSIDCLVEEELSKVKRSLCDKYSSTTLCEQMFSQYSRLRSILSPH